jgi:nitroreductase
MAFLDLALSRESAREYGDKTAIPRADLEMCVEAARHAPSACNSQPWRFIIVDDPAMADRIVDKTLSGIYKMNLFARGASAFIAIVSEKTKPASWAGGKLMRTDFRRIDIGIACAHLVLQAEDLGLANCILGWFNERALKKTLSIPASRKVELLISLGKPSGAPKRRKQRKPKKETVSFNSY